MNSEVSLLTHVGLLSNVQLLLNLAGAGQGSHAAYLLDGLELSAVSTTKTVPSFR